MNSFDEREKSFEKKFAHDQELQLKISARRNKYIGQWLFGEYEYYGTFIWVYKGAKYVGQFKDGKQSGKGKYTFASGKIHTGQYKEGKIIEGTILYTDGAKYKGQFE